MILRFFPDAGTQDHHGEYTPRILMDIGEKLKIDYINLFLFRP
jgi:hypothetical protein